MKKTALLLLLSYFISFPLFTEDMIQSNYATLQPAVVLIENSIYFDRSQTDHISTFQAIEKYKEINLLNNWLAVSQGSGFFITADGYIVTNNHVINADIKKITESKNNLFNYHLQTTFHDIPTDIVSLAKLNAVIMEFHDLISSGKIHQRVLVNNRDFYSVQTLITNEENDIALLKIEDSQYTFIPAPLGNSSSVTIGEPVAALGYPLQFEVTEKFDEIQATFTLGNLSAIRDDKWGLQHTAAINPGNSGGPLINKDGLIIGVNVGHFTSANSMFYSVPVDRVKKVLKEQDYTSLIKKNHQDCLTLKTYNKNLIEKGFLEIGQLMMIKCDPGKTVYLDKKKKGVTPLFLENLKKGKHTLRIEDDNEYSQITLIVNPDINSIETYIPVFILFTGKLIIQSTQNDASVFIDNIYMGKIPLVLNEIAIGEHSVLLEKESFFPHHSTISIKKGKTKKHTVTLKKGQTIHFSNKLPPYSKVEIKKGNYTRTYGEDEDILVDNGNWEITVINENLIRETLNVLINNQDATVDYSPRFYQGTVFLYNLRKESIVKLDDKLMTVNFENNSITGNVGGHTLIVQTDGFEDILHEIAISKMKPLRINLEYKRSIKYFKNNFRPLGVGFLVPGIILSLSGLFSGIALTTTFGNDIDLLATSPILNLFISAGWIILGGFGLPLIILSISLLFIKKQVIYQNFINSYKPFGIGLIIPGVLVFLSSIPLFTFGFLYGISEYLTIQGSFEKRYFEDPRSVAFLSSGIVFCTIATAMISGAIALFATKKKRPITKVSFNSLILDYSIKSELRLGVSLRIK